MTQRGDVTRMLNEISNDPQSDVGELLPAIYAELRQLAAARMASEKPGQTITPTALVHEAYLRLVGSEPLTWQNRRHFFGAAAEAMRRILIERARKRQRLKHGGGQYRLSLEPDGLASEPPAEELLALDESLSRLEALDESLSDVVKLRFFAGLTVEETAQALEVSERTVNRLWSAARAWLSRDLSRESSLGENATTPESDG